MPFPVLRKHAEGHVTCLGSYVVVDLLERWTGDKSLRRSVIDYSLGESAGDATNGREECEGSGVKAAPSRGVRFYHAVLQRVGEWKKDTAARAGAGPGCSGTRSGGGGKRKRCE